jgi:hypothetical protein
MMLQNKSEERKGKNFSLETVAELAEVLAAKTETAINKIDKINDETHVLAINALIEASRAGELGKAFSVVAEEMSELSRKISDTTENLRKESRDTITELGNIIKMQATNIRGVRLSDLALTNIDLIDRNLYERSCDVRWWARGSTLVNALVERTQKACDLTMQRLGIILDAYTVYFDIVLCDLEGNVIANGRPQQFKSVGTNQSSTIWFRSAIETATGNEFGFQSVHRCPLVNNQLALVYSCAVRENESANGKVIGVLGVVFNWEGLAQKIMHQTPLSEEEKTNSRICIVDDDGTILADSKGRMLDDAIQFAGSTKLLEEKKNFIIVNYEGSECCIAHAFSPGYETYSSGWHSLIIQRLKTK